MDADHITSLSEDEARKLCFHFTHLEPMLSLENKSASPVFSPGYLGTGHLQQILPGPTFHCSQLELCWVDAPAAAGAVLDRTLVVLHPSFGGVHTCLSWHDTEAQVILRQRRASELPPDPIASCDGPVTPPVHFRAGRD